MTSFEACASHHTFGPIEQLTSIETKARVKVWATALEIEQYTTWQLQQLRRAATLLGKLSWRDSQIRSGELRTITYELLVKRGAIKGE